MKKMVCLMLALLCACGVAFATSSPTIRDLPNASLPPMLKVEGVDDEEALSSGLYLELLNEFSDKFDQPEYQALKEVGDKELTKLQEAATVTEYFGHVIRASDGAVIPLLELFGGIEPELFEFSPVIAGGYQMHYGQLKATMLFATPYDEGEEVAVLIGAVDYAGEGEDALITWYVHRGVAVKIPEIDGADGIEVDFSPDMMAILQDVDTLIAVASFPKDNHEEQLTGE